MKVELLPCPFCGTDAWKHVDGFRVTCGAMECVLSQRYFSHEMWNRRAPSTTVSAWKELAAFTDAARDSALEDALRAVDAEPVLVHRLCEQAVQNARAQFCAAIRALKGRA